MPVGITTIGNEGKRSSATFVVAASDSLHKERADYVCDGVDDQVEIQAAIDAMTNGGLLFFLEGKFWLSSTINMPDVSGITIEGSGIGWQDKGSLLILADGANCSMFTKNHTAHTYFHSFKNFGMEGNLANQSTTTHGFNIVKQSSDIFIENLCIIDFNGDGIHIAPSTTCWNFWLSKLLIESNAGTGVYLDETAGGTISLGHVNECYTYANEYGIHGIGVTGGLIIANSNIQSNNKHGIYLQGTTRTIISSSAICHNCKGIGNNYDGIHLDDLVATPCDYIQITGCDLSDYMTPHRQRYGISLYGTSDYLNIANNNMRNNLNKSMYIGVAAGSHNIIKNNIGYVSKNSGTSTGTGAQQPIPHGLAATPTKVNLWNIEDGANPYQSAAADGTNIKITAVINQDWGWEAEV